MNRALSTPNSQSDEKRQLPNRWELRRVSDSELGVQDAASGFRRKVSGENLSHVIFTSGSTGTPKGAQRSEPEGLSSLAALLSKIPRRHHETVMIAAPRSAERDPPPVPDGSLAFRVGRVVHAVGSWRPSAGVFRLAGRGILGLGLVVVLLSVLLRPLGISWMSNGLILLLIAFLSGTLISVLLLYFPWQHEPKELFSTADMMTVDYAPLWIALATVQFGPFVVTARSQSSASHRTTLSI